MAKTQTGKVPDSESKLDRVPTAAKAPRIRKLAILVGLLVCLLVVAGLRTNWFNDDTPPPKVSQPPASPPASAAERRWHQGGTLHRATITKWRAATYDDKLATCGDFVSEMWENGSFRHDIQQQISDAPDHTIPLRGFAEELVTFIDNATKPDPDPQTDQIRYGYKQVADMASLAFIEMEWGNAQPLQPR